MLFRASSPSPVNRRSARAVLALVVVCATVGVSLVVSTGPAGAAPPTTNTSTYSAGTPEVATIANGASAAPWNTSQGDPSATAYPSSDLLPTYTPGGPGTGAGSTAEPNLAVYPGANSGTVGDSPYPSGVVGTPGPLDGYCGTGNGTAESAGSPVRQPAGPALPFAPAYFPHVVRNADGSLTGYFDYRPKDADEAIVAATSTDNGQSWTYDGEALEQNPGYCPSADINDDGQGHPNVITVGGTSYLYTLQRPAGDNAGVGMLVHALSPTAADPLAGLPSSEKVGIDPDAFATSGVSIPSTGGTPATVAVNQTGLANSPEQLVPGSFVDLTQTPVPTASSIITCTGVGATALTGCTSANPSGVTVNTGDLIEQVIGTVSTAETIPTGPNNSLGSGGLASLPVAFADNNTATILNNNAPNRIYVNGVAVYCDQSNANPTTKVEDCTTGPGGPAVTAAVGAPVTSDPIVPATAQQTTGLVGPDGIVGVLPSYPGAPSGSTVVMYTEKLLSYFEAGVTSAKGTYNSTSGSTIQFFATPTTTTALPTPSPSSPVTVEVADDVKNSLIPATCTGLTLGTGSLESNSAPLTDTLTGCTVPAADNGDTFGKSDQIGAPGATVETPAALAKTGEGSTNQDKLFKNNEDLSLLRVAYTTDGVNFSSSGLDNNGIISGQSSGASAYTDINDPSSTTDPPAGLNQYAAAGTTDATEMRWVGSAGSIITNPDGTYGLFLSGAWSADGDSDAFNQIFYSSSTDGEHWTEPVSVVSTDYSFSASVDQGNSLADGVDAPLGISAYYSGRAYGPSVVQNPNGTLTMIFAGYRLPKPIETAGTVLGTNVSAEYTVGATDPALYRNIMAVTLNSATAPAVGTQTTVTSSPNDPVAGQTVTYTATVGVTAPGTGTPTGSVSFSGDTGPLCPAAALSLTSPDTATCTTNYAGGSQNDTVTATYGGDSNYAGSSGSTSVAIGSALTLTKSTTTPAYGAAGDTLDYTYLLTNDGPDTLDSVAVDDDLIPSVSCPQSSLGAGASETCTGSYAVTQADVDHGSVTNAATASAADGSVAVGSNTSNVTVEAADATSALSLTTTATASYRSVGDTISFQYLATDTGTTTLSSIAVSDDLVPAATCPDPSLAPGASETCTGSYTVDQADVTAGSVTDSATAGGESPQGGSVSSATSLVTVPEAPTVTSTSSASGTEGVSFSFTVTTTGGPDKPAITTTSDLPAGVTLTDNGDGTATLAGTPVVGSAGTYPVTLTATDAAGSATQAFTLTVNPEAGFHISTTTLPDAAVGTSYSQQLHTSGAGTGTVKWAKIGALPRGFKLSPSGVLTGTPSAKAVGPFNVEVSASLNKGTPVTATIPLTVEEAPVFDPRAPLATSFADGTSGTFTVAAAGYPAPTITETGALPSGVTFSDGVLSGAPAVTADTSTSHLSITATNGVGTTATEGFTLTAIAPLVITTTTIPQGSPGASYGPVTLGVTGGEGAYTWKKTAALPRGMTLSSSGTLGGTLSTKLVAGQSYPVDVEVQVKEGRTKVTQTVALTLSVVA